MDFGKILALLAEGKVDEAIALIKAGETDYKKTVDDLKDYEGKFKDAVETRDSAKAKVKSIVEALGLTVEDATPEKVKEALKANSKSDDSSKEEIGKLEKIIEELNTNHNTALAEKDKKFTDILIEKEIAKHGVGADVVNEKALGLLVASLKEGATLNEAGEVVYLDGNTTARNASGRPLSVKERMEEFRADDSNAFLFKSTSQGGGGSSSSGVTGGKKFNELTSGELTTLRRENPAEYDRLKEEYNSSKN